MARVFLILVAVLAIGCSPKEVPQAPAVKPAIERVEAPVIASQVAAEKVSGLLSKAQQELAQSKQEGLAFKAEMERFRAEGMTVQEELARVWAELTRMEQRNLFLELTVDEAQATVRELELSLATAREATAGAIEVAGQKDTQVAALNTNLNSLKHDLAKAEKKLASANTYKRIVLTVAWGLAGFWVLREVVPLAIKTVKPL